MPENILIIGCGDAGKRVLNQLNQRNTSIYVTSHQKDSQLKLAKLNVSVIPADLDKPAELIDLPTSNANIFYFAPPVATGVTDTRMVSFIQSLANKQAPKRIVYISTTGVYGNNHGAWITEETKINPGNDRSKRRLHAESMIQEYCKNSSCEFIILRVTGIYCLEKLPLDRIKKGIKILDPDIAPASNRIHADDLASCCIKAMYHSPANEIFNIADGNPSSISDYFLQISSIFDLPKPTLLSWEQAKIELSPAMLSYLHESKKVNIDKIRDKLSIQLKYPNLKEGLISCFNLHQNS